MPTVHVVILFTDLVGSTELSARLDVTAAETLRQRHFALLRQAVADHAGREVKNTGDGLMVAFSSASAALACAVDMQQAIEAHSRKGADPLEVRIGLSAGEATSEDGDYFGDPVVEAARLCAKAGGGQILAADLVRVNAGRRATQTFEPLGRLDLKGLPEPLPTVEVLWEPKPVVGGIPRPARLEVRSPLGFVGRTRELAVLTDILKTVTAGEGRRIVLLAGEPGMGKTTLSSEFAGAAHSQGAIVLYGRCEEELGIPFQPFAEALGHYVVHASDEVLQIHAAAHAGDLAALVPALSQRLPGSSAARSVDPDTQRYLLFGAVLALLDRASGDGPVVLVLDDLHWADKPTLSLLRHLAGAPASTRLLVIGTYRRSELSKANPLTETLAALHRETGVDRLDLAGWDDTDVVALVDSGAGPELGEQSVEFAHALWRETDGNPFFVLQLWRHLAETGGLANGRFDELSLPQSVREVVGQRVARLGAETEAVLSDAAVVGRDFDVEVMGRLSGIDENHLVDLLDQAVQAALLVDVAPGRYSFAHAVIQHALYDALTSTRRALAHRRVAETLEALYGTGPGPRVGEVARHWLSATQPSHFDKALDYARWAGEAALAGLAPEEAARWFSQGLALMNLHPSPDPHGRAELLIGLGEAQRHLADPAHRDTLLEAANLAQSLGDTARLVRAALANNRGTVSAAGSVDVDRVAVLDAALAATAGETADRARLLATLVIELVWDPDRDRAALAAEARAMARRVGDPATFVRVACLLYFHSCYPDTLQDRLATTAEALDMASRLNDPALQHWATRFYLYARADAADIDGVDAALGGLVASAEQVGHPHFVWAAAFVRSWRAQLAGDLEEAERWADEALRIGTRSGDYEAPAIYPIQMMGIRRQQGRMAELEASIAEAARAYSQLPMLRVLQARLYCDLGRDAEARQLIEADLRNDFGDYFYDFTWSFTMGLCASVCADLREHGVAERLYERLAPWHDQLTASSAAIDFGVIAHGLGKLAVILGRDDAAADHFVEAVEIGERMRAPYWTAEARLDLARLLSTRPAPDDRRRALDLLDLVDAAAVEYGFAGLLRQTAELRS